MARLLHIKVERSLRNQVAIQDAFSVLDRAHDLVNVAQSKLRSDREVCEDLKMDGAGRSKGDMTAYRRKAVEEKDDSEVNDTEDREVENALRWLRDEWESLAKILRQTDSGIDWDSY